MNPPILISGGAGYIGSHAAYGLKQAGYKPVVIDNLSTGHAWAAKFGAFEQGDIGDSAFIRAVCDKYQPVAALHFAAFIEVGESVRDPAKYITNNRDKAAVFFKTLNACGVCKIVFSSTAAVYGEGIGGEGDTYEPLSELSPTKPINPYGQSKLDAEAYLRMLDAAGLRSVTLRYFNVAGAAPADTGIGEAHVPESHLIPRLVLPLIGMPQDILQGLGLVGGLTIYGDDYPTPDGTAIRDYIHVMDLVDAHIRALEHLINGGATDIFNLGSGKGFSVREIIETARHVLNCPTFIPGLAPRRAGDPAQLIASTAKAGKVLCWKTTRTLANIIGDAAIWHCSPRYGEAVRTKIGKNGAGAL
jgi:UDP-glucose-4-epimerase GalE